MPGKLLVGLNESYTNEGSITEMTAGPSGLATNQLIDDRRNIYI